MLLIIFLCKNTQPKSLGYPICRDNTGNTLGVSSLLYGKQNINHSPLAISWYPAQHHCTHGRTNNWVSRVAARCAPEFRRRAATRATVAKLKVISLSTIRLLLAASSVAETANHPIRLASCPLGLVCELKV